MKNLIVTIVIILGLGFLFNSALSGITKVETNVLTIVAQK